MRWYLAQSERGAIAWKCDLMTDIASPDGTLAKTGKTALLVEVETTVSDCHLTTVPAGCDLLIDNMALIHTTRSHRYDAFGCFAAGILTTITLLYQKFNSSRVDFVTDTYPAISIKSYEHSHRGSGAAQRIRILNKDQPLPAQWQKFLDGGPNIRENLIKFSVSIGQLYHLVNVSISSYTLAMAHNAML